ncbi:hypothetical protein [Castellaniella sp.]|uniref:hypothetical protein n=1 Tax=Castellaniella sp. TaxID=1955812 RepID=UPI002AFDDC3B|nr:hypothetical protein [Castellaniella sp.]
MAESAENTGIVEHTKGKKFGWYGEGKATIAAGTDFSMSYGVKNEITLGVVNEFSAAMKTGVSIGATFEAGLSTGHEFKKSYTIAESAGVASHSDDNQSISTGGDVVSYAKTTAIKTAIKVLIGAQAALLLGAAATIIAKAALQTNEENDKVDKENEKNETENKAKIDEAQKKYDKEKEDYDAAVKSGSPKDPKQEAELEKQAAAIQAAKNEMAESRKSTSSLELEDRLPTYIFSAISLGLYPLVAISTILKIALDKLEDGQYNNKPAAVLSLNKVAAAFLGVRAPTGATGSAGISLNTTGITLSTATADLQYEQVTDDASITRFTTKPDAFTTNGSRLDLDNSGLIQTWGQQITNKAKGSIWSYSPLHALQVVSGNGISVSYNRLQINDEGTTIRAAQNTALRVRTNKTIQAEAGKGVMVLDDTHANIGHGGNALTCNGASVKLAFGATTNLTIDSTGISIGGAITILAPGGPLPTSTDLAAIQAGLLAADASNAALETRLQAAELKARLMEESVAKLDKSVIAAHSRVTAAARRAKRLGGR